jgi:protoporphyrinogen oxidase
MIERNDVLILGSGLTGLSAAWELGDRATVIEREDRPGGLVRTERLGDYWFDHVVHLLYFQDPDTERRIRGLLGNVLAPCPPRAWVETPHGTTRFPFQLNLGGLNPETCVRCLKDLAELTYRPPAQTPRNFEEMLLLTFGRAMCDTFLFPYNRKMWKRPLNKLAPSGFTWNITRPDFEKVLQGAVCPEGRAKAYNSAGWYPRPPASSPIRGMEVLSAALADQAADIRLQHTVKWIDLETRVVTVERVERNGERRMERLRYNDALLSTLPLPRLIRMCEQTPPGLRESCARLTRNRVISVALAVEGPRPEAPGHWRYYGDESLIFTRLVFLHEFDALCAPPSGWSLLVEITEPAEAPLADLDVLLQRVLADVQRAGAIPAGSRILAHKFMKIDPAYVVFSLENQPVVAAAQKFLESYGVSSVGRYGNWEYSGMSSCMRDGFAWAANLGQPVPVLEEETIGELVAAGKGE